jgi:hypothetical protein
MVGWGTIPEGEPTNPRIYVFGKDYRWRIADHPIEDATNQVRQQRSQRTSVVKSKRWPVNNRKTPNDRSPSGAREKSQMS